MKALLCVALSVCGIANQAEASDQFDPTVSEIVELIASLVAEFLPPQREVVGYVNTCIEYNDAGGCAIWTTKFQYAQPDSPGLPDPDNPGLKPASRSATMRADDGRVLWTDREYVRLLAAPPSQACYKALLLCADRTCEYVPNLCYSN